MTRIYLVRHAEAEGNLYRIAQGQYNSILTDRGWRQVEALRQRFADIQIDAVYASDLYRTRATASAIYRPKGLELRPRRDLREICVGRWEQQTWGDIARTDQEQLVNFNLHPEKWYVEGAETPRQVLKRVLSAVKEIAGENEGKTIAVVSHGYAIRLLLAELEGYSLDRLSETPVGGNTAVSLVEAENGRMRVVFRDDVSHLQTEAYLAGEKPRKRDSALEPGLCFAPLRMPEQEDFLVDCVSAVWAESGKAIPFDRGRLLADAAARTTLVGYLGEKPVGLVQLGPETGWISLACVEPACRGRGFGVQLLGQAVRLTREREGRELRLSLAESASTAGFFRQHGFRAHDGQVLAKDIGYDPEYL